MLQNLVLNSSNNFMLQLFEMCQFPRKILVCFYNFNSEIMLSIHLFILLCKIHFFFYRIKLVFSCRSLTRHAQGFRSRRASWHLLSFTRARLKCTASSPASHALSPSAHKLVTRDTPRLAPRRCKQPEQFLGGNSLLWFTRYPSIPRRVWCERPPCF